MRLVVVVDQRYWTTPGGAAWTRMPPDLRFFETHLAVFDHVRVIARTIPVPHPPNGSLRVDGPRVSVWAVPAYSGPLEFALRLPEILESLRHAVEPDDALLLRVPSQLANMICALHPEHAASVEVLGDPWELYSPRATGCLIRPFYRWWFSSRLKRQCSRAAHAAYVSQAVARRYPAARSRQLLDIELDNDAFGASRDLPVRDRYRIVSTGGFERAVKGHDTLIRAIGRMKIPAELTIVGAGDPTQLSRIAERCGVALRFSGELPGAAAVREVVRSADLFALASRSEGKPRSVIEAMALGVPCVATRVGGIPELLPETQLADRDDEGGLARLMDLTLADPLRYLRLSREGIVSARAFSAPEQRGKRLDFLRAVRGVVPGETSLEGVHDRELIRG